MHLSPRVNTGSASGREEGTKTNGYGSLSIFNQSFPQNRADNIPEAPAPSDLRVRPTNWLNCLAQSMKSHSRE